MNENAFLAKTLNEQITAGFPAVLVSIMSLQGSTPRHDGAKMLVGADGKPYGTIGGSLIEASAIRESKNILASKKSSVLIHELTGKDTTDPGMICGGKAELLLDYFAASEENREFSQCWCDAVEKGKDFYILTHLQNTGEALKVLGHAVLDAEGNLTAASSLSAADAAKLKPELHNVSATAVLLLPDSQVMVDRIRRLKTVYCFGAGHVAVPTAHLAALVGFRVVVIDDRPEYANAARFPESETRVILDFNRALQGLEIDKDSFIVIVTRGHQFDREVLEQSLKTSAGYIGMISSRRKREAIYQTLIAQGIAKNRLEWVHSPIGLDIGGETPEEIAVSIVAELVSERSKQSA
jgi:xanthine dehydrogenase accessory factor